jgi:hypothetical protein
MIDSLYSGIDRAERRIYARELSGCHGIAAKLVKTIDIREVEDSVEHKCAQREKNVSHDRVVFVGSN